jgi:hypothetical protein
VALSALVHVTTLYGLDVTSNVRFLEFGVIGVLLPLVLAPYLPDSPYRGMNAWDIAKIIERGCPFWMQFAAGAIGVYSIVNFVVSMFAPELNALRISSAGWMALYASGFIVYFAGRSDTPAECA